MVQQIVHHLLDNAIKFSERGAVRVTVGAVVRDDRRWLEIGVEDTGIGLSAADSEALRAAFADTERPLRLGSGQGLHLARKFAGRIGGRLELESRPGGGSRFALLLPEE
jgi:signal transduction histidine kinase